MEIEIQDFYPSKPKNDKEAERWQDQLAFNFGEYCEISRQIRDREQEAFEDVA